MDLDVIFLGTGGATPTPGRGMPAVLVRAGGNRILVDCGEGTQRQLMRSVGLADIDVILITHAHMDHYLGLPAMLKTFQLRERDAPLTIAFPSHFGRVWKLISPLVGRVSYPLTVRELEPGDVLGAGPLDVTAFETDHSIPSLGYRLDEPDLPGRVDAARARELGVTHGPDFGILQRGGSVTLDDDSVVNASDVVGPTRRGRSIAITGDTTATPEVRDAVDDVDLLVHEATFGEDEAERARATRHSTAHDAALLAAAAQPRLLAITHSSSRYFGSQLLDEAQATFQDTVSPRDFDLIDIPLRDRGDLVLVRSGARPRRAGKPAPAAN